MTRTPQQSPSRPPIVTVLGHVDHGKTTLLDFIRKANVAAGESGGITQHVGAYQAAVTVGKETRTVTFIDTPGHAAFHQMRSRGARVADIAILVVAADDGVMPQTREAIQHIKEAGIPFVVAVNKMDKPDANPSKLKAELAEAGVIVESFGGDVPDAEISAKEGRGIQELLELLVLTADLHARPADPAGSAEGVVIEGELDPKRGALATLLVRNGTIRLGDTIATPTLTGTARALEDFRGDAMSEASPSMPVRVMGLPDVPVVGEPFRVVQNDRDAEAFQREHRPPTTDRRRPLPTMATVLPIVLKADAKGTLEALVEMIETVEDPNYAVSIVTRRVGPVSDSDIRTAESAGAVVAAFRVPVLPAAERSAADRDITILRHDVIYELVEIVKKQLTALLQPQTEREDLGTVSVLVIFRDDHKTMVVGGKVTNGVVRVRSLFDIRRGGDLAGRGTIIELKRGQKNTPEIKRGEEVGLRVETTERLAEGDTLLVFQETKKKTVVR